MASLGNHRHHRLQGLDSTRSNADSFEAKGGDGVPDVPPCSEVYRVDRSVAGYGEHWKLHRGWSVLGAWWGKLTRSSRDDGGRVVHIEDHRAIEIAKADVPAEIQRVNFRLVDEASELGFSDFRYTRYFDPFNRLEFVTVYAVQPKKSAVLRIIRRRAMDEGHSLEVEIEILTVYPDGSVLVTTSERPRLCAPTGEKCQVKKDAGPRELWASHLKALARIPFPPKPTANAAAAWDLTNEVESGRARFHLTRGFYAVRPLAECARDALRLLKQPEPALAPSATREERKWMNWSFFSIAQMSGAVSVAIAICMVSADLQPTSSMPPLTASQKRRLAQKSQVNAQVRLSRSVAVELRDSK